MEGAVLASSQSGSLRQRQTGDSGPKFYQTFSHAEFLEEDSVPLEEDTLPSVKIWKQLLALTFTGMRRFPGSRWLFHHFSAHEVKLKAPVLSGSGAHIAVLHESTVTFLTQMDDYNNPIGIFAAASQAEVFLHGAWIDDWEVLVVASTSRVIYFLDCKARELSKISVPDEGEQIVGLVVVPVHRTGPGLQRYDVVILTSSGSLRRYEVDRDTIPLLPVHHAADSCWDVSHPHPWGVWSLFFHPDQSTMVVAGPARGSDFTLSLWRLSGSPLSLGLLYCSSISRGLSQWISWPCRWSSAHILATPKVALSSNFQFVALLHPDGKLHIRKLNTTDWMLEELATVQKDANSREGEDQTSQDPTDDYFSMLSHGVEDFGWWFDNSLIVANRRYGSLDLLQLPSLQQLWAEARPALSSHVRLTQVLMGRVFFVELLTRQESTKQSAGTGAREKCSILTRFSSHYSKVLSKAIHGALADASRSGWRLMSLVEKSEHEMYLILIEQGKYDLAVKMAEKYCLDTDEVYKGQWRRSDYGREAVQRLFPTIKDLKWIVNESLDKICSSTEAMNALLDYGLTATEPFVHREGQEQDDGVSDQVWWFSWRRLRLLQYKDRLDTFLAMHLGRFFHEQYTLFRTAPLHKVAIGLAEEGKTGPLELLMKRHLYSLSPHLFAILNAIPETIAPHSYVNLLPSIQPPTVLCPRKSADWVEKGEILEAVKGNAGEYERMRSEVGFHECTEHMVMLSTGLVWPSEMEIIEWYRRRARGIDKTSGQLENSLTLLNVGLEKGVNELDCLFEDVSDLYWLVFGTGDSEDAEVDISLFEWEHLKDFEKFSYMLRGATSLNVIDKLRERGVPFMRRKYGRGAARKKSLEENGSADYFEKQSGSLVEWLRQSAEDNKLEICAVVLSEGIKGPQRDWLFEDETDLITAALECVYSGKQTDQWALLGAILQKLPRNHAVDKEHVRVDEEQPSKGFRSGLASVFRNKGVSKSLTMLPLLETGLPPLSGDQVIPEELDARLKQAEGFVEIGRLFASYQVNIPMSSLLATEGDPNARKQFLRSLLARFSRRQPPRTDGEWINLWHDFRILHEKAAFLDKEYLLAEFCRGLLKAGKLSLAKTYLKGNGSVVLPKEQVERIVLHAAREYFYSASSLDSSEVEIAKQCLALLPDSESSSAEANIFEAVTLKLPMLGVTLLPMEFRQMTNRMEVIKRALAAHPDSYLNVQELISAARLLGLNSPDDISEVEVEIARMAFGAGDIELTRELCLEVVRKGYSPAWDLCSAIGRRSELDLNSRKELLEFAVNHCDSGVSEELKGILTEVSLSVENAERKENITSQVSSVPAEKRVPATPILASSPPLSPSSGAGAGAAVDGGMQEPDKVPERGWAGQSKFPDTSSASVGTSAFWKRGREYLSKVTKATHISSLYSSEVVARKKIIGFSCLELPWLVELGLERTAVEEDFKDVGEDKWAEVTRATYMHAKKVARSNSQESSGHLQPQWGDSVGLDDKVLLTLAREAFSSPVSRVGDMVACGYLLNLSNPQLGIPVFEQEWNSRSDHKEILQLMRMALIYCQLQDASASDGANAAGKSPDWLEGRNADVESSSFWTNWRLQIEAKVNLLRHAHLVKQLFPGVEMKRFADGDDIYIRSVVLKMVESLPNNHMNLFTQLLEVADFYGVKRSEVLLQFLFSLLLSDMVTERDIKSAVSQQWDELTSNPSDLLQALIANVYPHINGVNKQRLAYFYELLSDCSAAIRREESGHHGHEGWQDSLNFESLCYRTMANECLLMDSVEPELNFKNVIGIDELDPMLATKEISKFVDESNVRRFADFMTNLQPFLAQKKYRVEGEFPSAQSIYLSLIKKLLGCLTEDASEDAKGRSVVDLDDAYGSCRIYLGYLTADQLKEVLQSLILGSMSSSLKDAVAHEHMLVREGSKVRESALNHVILVWIQVLQDIQMVLSYHENPSNPAFIESLDEMLSCLRAFSKLVAEGRVKPKQGLRVVDYYVSMVPFASSGHDVLKFLRSMVLAGCLLQWILVVLDNLVISSSKDVGSHDHLASGSLSSDQTSEQDGQEGRQVGSSLCGAMETPSNRKIPDIVNVYLQLVDSALGAKQVYITNSLSPQLEELKGIMTSLSVLEDDTVENRPARHWQVGDILSKLRAEVWRQSWRSMKDTDIDIHIRISLFELLEAIQGKARDSPSDDADEPIIRWEGWNGNNQEPLVSGKLGDVDLSMFLSVMRSTQILYRLWPGIQVAESDIGTTEAAISLFSRLVASSSSANHVLALKSLLQEWDGLFDAETADSSTKESSRKGADGWDGWDEEDDWGEGWQDYHDSKDGVTPTLNVHPLHSCWKVILHKLFQQRCDSEALQVLDSALTNSSGVLLTEDEVKELVGKLGEKNAMSALKMALLLPYEFPRSLALQLFAQDLESGDEDDQDVLDSEDSSPYESLLALVMSAGVLPSIAENPQMQNVFSSLVVTLRRLGQKLQQQRLQEARKGQKPNLPYEGYIPLYRIAFPLFVGELTGAKQFEDAGALVLQYMRVPPARATKTAAVNTLKSYLQTEVSTERGRARPTFPSGQGSGRSRRFESYLGNTMQLLDRRLGEVLSKAADTVAKDLR